VPVLPANSVRSLVSKSAVNTTPGGGAVVLVEVLVDVDVDVLVIVDVVVVVVVPPTEVKSIPTDIPVVHVV
jgi:hypothetical protein